MIIRTHSLQLTARGFTLVELLIGLVIGLLVSAAALAAFLAHSRTVYEQVGFNQSTEDINEAYAILSRLIIQSQRDSIAINRTVSGGVVTDITIDLALPEGFSVWPNQTAPFDDNWVRIAWDDESNEISVVNAATEGGLADEAATVFAGGNEGNVTRITHLDLVEDESTAPSSYLFAISGKAWSRFEMDQEDGDNGSTIEGRILPRN